MTGELPENWRAVPEGDSPTPPPTPPDRHLSPDPPPGGPGDPDYDSREPAWTEILEVNLYGCYFECPECGAAMCESKNEFIGRFIVCNTPGCRHKGKIYKRPVFKLLPAGRGL